MKKIILAAVLFGFAALSGCKGTPPAAGVQPTAVDSVAAPATGGIAYINMDSLLSNYAMYTALQTEFAEKARKAESDITARGGRLERDIADFQKKVENVLITRAQATEMEADLQKRQQELMQYGQRIQGELAEEEAVMLNRIQFSINEFLREFNAGYRYSMILTTSSATGTVIDADPSLDITRTVVDGLNKKYAESNDVK